MTEMVDVKTLQSENQAMAQKAAESRDSIDEKLEVWLREIPDLDARTEGIVDRIGVIQKYLRRTHDETLEQFGLTWGDAKVLSSLRYGGPPYRSTPGRLGSQLGLSSGAMTARLDKMEEAKLIRRLPDPADRRGVLIELTDRGRELWEQSVAMQAEKEATVASALSRGEQDQLNRLLRRLVLAFSEEYGPLSKRRP
jgi:DNA-binding MarR family transcriptional regulator